MVAEVTIFMILQLDFTYNDDNNKKRNVLRFTLGAMPVRLDSSYKTVFHRAVTIFVNCPLPAAKLSF